MHTLILRLGSVYYGQAFVVSSGLVAGALTAVSWLVRPPYLQKSTSTVADAYEWCAGLLSADERAGIPTYAWVDACLTDARAHTAPKVRCSV